MDEDHGLIIRAGLEPPEADRPDGTFREPPTMAKQWYVLRVASNKEDQVREALTRKVKIEALEERIGRILVPTERRPSPRARGEKKFVERKMYPGYVFIEMELEEDGTIDDRAWFLIKETTGVGDFIGATGKPTPIPAAQKNLVLCECGSHRPERRSTAERALLSSSSLACSS